MTPIGGTCSQCAAELSADARFCQDCGQPVAVRACPGCGAPAPTGRFCIQCGAEIEAAPTSGDLRAAPVSERRITTVLFGDLVGFTAMSESRDSEEVRELLTRYFDRARIIVQRYGGTVEKFIGDAVMAVWGVPATHEDDAERAVRAGLELVEMARSLGDDAGAEVTMRVGLVTGEVATTVGATNQGMVAGDAVNTASRVQSAAAPGEVWVDDTTRALTSAAIAYADVGEHELKGKTQPIRLFCAQTVVASVGGVERVDGLEAPLAGRDREIRMLKELFHGVEDRRAPALVLVEGEAGVGKSRMGWEFEKYIDGLRAAVRWHRGRCLAYGEGVSFWALAEALRGRLDLVEKDPAEVVEERIDAGLDRYVPDDDERRWIRPRLAVLLGADAEATHPREELFAAWAAFLERVGETHPVVLVVDDAQHADDGLLDFTDYVLSRGRSGIFILMLARPGVLTRRPELAAHRRVTVLHLDPLDAPDMGRLVDGLVDGLPEDVQAALVERAEGIPLFAVETVRGLIDRDLVIPRDGRYVLADAVELDVRAIGAPASLQTLVAARLDALSPDERRIIADASVLGVTFDAADLSALVGDTGLVDQVTSALVHKQILAVETDRFSSSRGQLRFVQTVVRQVAYDTLSRRDRKARHLAVAQLLLQQEERVEDDAAVIAQHYLDAVDMSAPDDVDRDSLNERASSLLATAAKRASSLGSPVAALRYLQLALGSALPDQQAALHEQAAQAAQDCAHYDESVAHAQQSTALYEEQGDPVGAGRAAAIYGRTLSRGFGDASRAAEVMLPHWRALATRQDADSALQLLAYGLDAAYTDRGDFSTGAEYRERLLRIAEASGDLEQMATSWTTTALYYMSTGAPRTAQTLLSHTALLARELGSPGVLARALLNLGVDTLPNDPAEAARLGREAMAAASLSGVAGWEHYSRLNLMLALWVSGEWEELSGLALDPADLSTDIAQLHVAIRCWLSAAQHDGTAALTVDRPDRRSEEGLAFRGWHAHVEALRLHASGEHRQAALAGIESVELLMEYGGLSDDFMHIWPAATEEAIEAGMFDEAEALLAHVGEAPSGLRSPALVAHLHRLRGLLGGRRGDDPSRVESDLRQAIKLFTDYGSPPFVARAEESLGRFLAGQGRADEGEHHLSNARARYEALGAHGWLAAMDAATTHPVR
ncbi:MAG: adenylate/guanylate cyclase domain-containing protein [Candidatus Nanopelagicales bacterium]